MKLGQCHEDSRQLGDEEFVAVRKYPLLAETAPNIFGRAVGIHRGNDNYNQVTNSSMDSCLSLEKNFEHLYNPLYDDKFA
jgi:hypothetical protein